MTRRLRFVIAGGVATAAIASGVAVWGGVYDVAADRPHLPLTAWLLETARDRSIAVRAAQVQVPTVPATAERLRRGAGNYDAMCASCHLAPGMEPTELSRGLYPQPPALAQAAPVEPARAYWVIKHGIKASGMPAWGKSMDDEAIWDLVAFLGALPRMTQAQYASQVLASGGHSHGGVDTAPGAPPGRGHAMPGPAHALPDAAPDTAPPQRSHGAAGHAH